MYFFIKKIEDFFFIISVEQPKNEYYTYSDDFDNFDDSDDYNSRLKKISDDYNSILEKIRVIECIRVMFCLLFLWVILLLLSVV